MKHVLDEAVTGRSQRVGILRNRDIRLIIGGRTISLVGDQIAVVAITMYAYAAGWGTTGVAAVLVASTLPLVFGAPLAGMVVDRVPSRLLTISAAIWEGACVLGLALVVLSAPRSPVSAAGVLVLLFALGAGQAVSGPAWTALVPTVCDPRDVGQAVGAVQAATTLASVLGPALGGVIVAAGGTVPALLADAVTFVALAMAAVAVRGARVPAPHAAGRSSLWAGFTAIGSDPVLRPLIGGMVVLTLCLHVILVIEVFLVTDVFGAGARGYGLVGTAVAAGMVGGSLLGARIDGDTRRLRIVAGCFAALPTAVLLAGVMPSLAAFAVAMFGVGLANGVLTVCINTVLLTRVADAVRGRVLAAVVGAAQTCNLVGIVAGGPLGQVAGPRAVFVGAGCAGLLVGAVVVAASRRTLVHAPCP